MNIIGKENLRDTHYGWVVLSYLAYKASSFPNHKIKQSKTKINILKLMKRRNLHYCSLISNQLTKCSLLYKTMVYMKVIINVGLTSLCNCYDLQWRPN